MRCNSDRNIKRKQGPRYASWISDSTVSKTRYWQVCLWFIGFYKYLHIGFFFFREYLNDFDRNELSQKAVSICIHVYQTTLNKLEKHKKDAEILALLVDIFKAHRKCVKNMPHKESLFTEVLKQAYKIYVQDKAKLPESANILDLSIKLCTYEINYRKSIEKMSGKQDKSSKIINTSTDMPSTMITPMQPISAVSKIKLVENPTRLLLKLVRAPTDIYSI